MSGGHEMSHERATKEQGVLRVFPVIPQKCPPWSTENTAVDGRETKDVISKRVAVSEWQFQLPGKISRLSEAFGLRQPCHPKLDPQESAMLKGIIRMDRSKVPP